MNSNVPVWTACVAPDKGWGGGGGLGVVST